VRAAALLALNEPLTVEQNAAVLARLSEMQEQGMIEPCMRMILGEDGEKADQAVQAILLFGQPAAKMALSYLDEGNRTDKVLDRLADVVASCGPCEGAFVQRCGAF
jgi:hypothetical protein